jgi:hypothetical protein
MANLNINPIDICYTVIIFVYENDFEPYANG